MAESDGHMSDDAGGDDDIVRRHEEEDEDDDVVDGAAAAAGDQYDNVSMIDDQEVKDGEDDEAKKVDPASSKKKVTRKLIVLNTERLKGSKGVHTIEKLYEGFKFKGKGHEKDDLDRVMKRLEYWAFRLFPKLEFDDFLAKCEHLGPKKDLQVHLKKYRKGMITADHYVQDDIIEDEREDNEPDPAIVRTEREMLAEIADENFQRVFDETAANSGQNENL